MNKVDDLLDSSVVCEVEDDLPSSSSININDFNNGKFIEERITFSLLTAIVFCSILVPIKELIPYVKEILKSIMIHDWIAHLVFSLIIFGLSYYIIPKSLYKKITRPDVLILKFILLSCLVIIGFYCFHQH